MITSRKLINTVFTINSAIIRFQVNNSYILCVREKLFRLLPTAIFIFSETLDKNVNSHAGRGN